MYIHLKGLKLFAFHGVLPQENKVGAEYTLNLRLKTDFSRASQTDDLNYTINYAEVFNRVKEEMTHPSLLLEHAGGRILNRLFTDFPNIEQIELELLKQNPPMGADCTGAGILLTVEREEWNK